ncbi:hypothetical protein FSP39_014576 [Pinctada imbricata]|uniref:Uncharacterized protein n=1 Tax=Pinctada imbricata TaxID=66713 RepID=A0AA88YMS1_PINIB|nr:hypothetical protein FSP39_014576 [Pinctada imbricata]
MTVLNILLILLFSIILWSKVGEDPGFELYYGQSNVEKYENHPIQFENALPNWIKGSLINHLNTFVLKIRNGPGRFEIGNRKMDNLFDGFAKLTKWTFPGNGSAYFSTKFLRSSLFNDSMAINDIAPYMTISPVNPPFTVEQTLESLQNGMDNPNVNIYNFTSDSVALNDMWILYTFDPKSLTLQQKINAEIPDAKLGFPFISPISSAHPLPEPNTNNHLTSVGSLALIPRLKHKLSLIRVKSSREREMIAQWSVDNMSYMHSFSVTEKYALFLASPYYYEVKEMFTHSDVAKSMKWFPDQPSLVYVVELYTGRVRTFKTEAMFSMHHINAFDIDQDHIAMDVAAFKEAGFFSSVSLNVLRNQTLRNAVTLKSQVKRYVLNFKDNTVDIVTFPDSQKIPFASRLLIPTINENYRSKKYCFAYGLVMKMDGVNYANMSEARKDLCGNSTDKAWSLKNHYLTEAWFVPNPQGTEEDDGYLMFPALDGVNRHLSLPYLTLKP